MKYIIIIYLLVAGSSCKQDVKADQVTQEIPDVIKFDDLNVLKEEQLKKLIGLKEMSAKTMVKNFGQPRTITELFRTQSFIYTESNENGFIFKIKRETYPNKNLELVMISAVYSLPEFKLIWETDEHREEQEREKKQGKQDTGLNDSQLKKLNGLEKLNAKTMVDFFGEPSNFDGPFADAYDGPLGEPFDEEELEKSDYAYYGLNKRKYFFEIKKGTYSSKHLEAVLISAVRRYPEDELIWQSQEELEKLKKKDE